MKMKKNIIAILITVGFSVLSLVSCKKSEAPDGTQTANVSVVLKGDKTRAAFVGGTNQNDPSKIAWGKKGDKLPMLVYKGNGTTATSAELELSKEYVGTLKFAYNPSELDASNKSLKYFVTSAKNTKASFGASILSGAVDASGKISFKTEKPSSATAGDFTSKEVDWPLVGVEADKSGATTNKLWINYLDQKRNYVTFNLFGDILWVRFDNIMEIPNYNAHSTGDTQHLPKLTIESNGMAFVCSEFTATESNGVTQFTASKPATSVTHILRNLDFSNGNHPMLPVWFRPYKPANNAALTIKITWEVYNGTSWEKQVYNFNPKAKPSANGTPFAKTDGTYYGMSVGISTSPTAEFGSNSFYIVEANIPAFD